MELTVLGSGTLLPDRERGSACHLVETNGAVVLLDCGAGCLKAIAQYGPSWESVTHIVLSHLHVDHVGALAPLLWAFRHGRSRERSVPLCLVGPRGLEEHLNALTTAFGSFILDPGIPLELLELESVGEWVDPAGRFRLAHCPTPHTANSYAMRLETDDGAVGYTGDTGPSLEVAQLMRDVGALVVECSRSDDDPIDGHLTPSTLAALLEVARPALAVVTHVYPGLDSADVPDLVAAAGYTGDVLAARDGLCIRIENHLPVLVG